MQEINVALKGVIYFKPLENWVLITLITKAKLRVSWKFHVGNCQSGHSVCRNWNSKQRRYVSVKPQPWLSSSPLSFVPSKIYKPLSLSTKADEAFIIEIKTPVQAASRIIIFPPNSFRVTRSLPPTIISLNMIICDDKVPWRRIHHHMSTEGRSKKTIWKIQNWSTGSV